ncbi:TetR/AcrR family transcriptional regulator [Micromonospora carbonacea]|uniref:TetR/AcrR family transcriptional regulator n=1 Tax=Micromonospora carbonacea TaxID=47853 RepID=UPI003723245B
MRQQSPAASLAEVSIEDVCRAAGVHKGSLYFFPSKEALGEAVVDRNWDMMHAVRKSPSLLTCRRWSASTGSSTPSCGCSP